MKITRTARRLNTEHLLVNKTPPPADSLSWRLWLNSQDIAREALNTAYVQGIRLGTLDPNDYARYTVHDAAYCYHGEEDYRKAVIRAREEGEPEIASFAEIRYHSYKKYREEAFSSWGLQKGAAIDPSDVVRAYIDIERQIATTAPPIYLAIAMIPCDQLWAWLAAELQADANSANVYNFWITENASWSGAYCLDNFVDRWAGQNPAKLDESKALAVYRTCMTCEVNSFRAITGQDTLPVPPLPAF